MMVMMVAGNERLYNSYEGKINTNKREVIMNIKERIKTIIEDYSFAKDEANVRNNIKRTYKGPSEATESLWDYVKDPILLKVKGLASYTNSLINKIRR